MVHEVLKRWRKDVLEQFTLEEAGHATPLLEEIDRLESRLVPRPLPRPRVEKVGEFIVQVFNVL